MLNVAMLSKWHVHADGYARQVRDYGAKITAVWDEQPARGQEWAKALGVDFEAGLDQLLGRADVDAVVVDAPTSLHREVMVAAARAGKHIFTEKAMAPTVKECQEIAAAVREAGVKFLISMPQRTSPVTLFAKKLIDEGVLGQISLVRLRNGHNGSSGNWLPAYWYDEATAGGGAMMDLGCHPMYTASYLLGKPARISSIYNTLTGKSVEDNAVNVIEFCNKAVAIVETSFVSFNTPGAFEIYGTDGTFIANGNEVKVACKRLNDVCNGFVTANKLPPALPAPLTMFLDACTKGTPIHFGLEDGIALTELLENAYLAHRKNTVVEIA
jgi:predicted dehydrogenase